MMERPRICGFHAGKPTREPWPNVVHPGASTEMPSRASQQDADGHRPPVPPSSRLLRSAAGPPGRPEACVRAAQRRRYADGDCRPPQGRHPPQADAHLQTTELVLREVVSGGGRIRSPPHPAGMPGPTWPSCGGRPEGGSVGHIHDPAGAAGDCGPAAGDGDHVRAAARSSPATWRSRSWARRPTATRPPSLSSTGSTGSTGPGTASTGCGWATCCTATSATPGSSTRASASLLASTCRRPSSWSGPRSSWR